MEHVIDATNKPLGRVASEAALILRGKDKASFLPHVKPTTKVKIENANQIKFSGAKVDQKTYIRYSGYPGGLKTTTLSQMIEKKGMEEVVKKAVYGMLPNNKLRAIMMKNLTITR